ncbi:MAG: hypothetical protein ACI841_005028 [Planctomycetota bacterium]|jgi:hypothetical protein
MRSIQWPTFAALLIATSSLVSAQKLKLNDKTQPRTAPINCPYTQGNPELLAAAGIVSLGGFEFANDDNTAKIDAFLSSNAIYWAETEHFEIGFALGSIKVTPKEKKKILSELTLLQTKLPTVKPTAKILDPRLRLYLYCQRLEQAYDQFLQLVDKTHDDFPSGEEQWLMGQVYRGQGPYLGETGKYEVLVLPNEGSSKAFLNKQFGLNIKLSQRYNVVDKGTLIFVVHTMQGGLKVDEALHGHLVFNSIVNFVDGYLYYAYDTPPWIHEGLAHWFERRINPKYNTFDSSEGAVAEMTRKENWEPPTRKLVASDEAPSMASLLAMRGYGEMKLDHHFTTWSMVDYLQREHPGFIGKLLDAICGVKDERGLGDGSNVAEIHRLVFKDELGMSYMAFDRHWKTWVLENYSAR